MTTERRTDARGKAIARVTFTDATSDKPAEAQLRDIGRGGMFLSTTSPLPVGKRIDFEVHLATGGTIVGMARVVWSREAAAGDLPAGMGIKFIDVDNDALAAIDRLVGLKKNVRERTVLGLSAPTPAVVAKPEPKAAAPIQSRERTVLGVAPPAQREKELSWPDEPPPAAKEETKSESESQRPTTPAPESVSEPEPEKPAVAVAVEAPVVEAAPKAAEPAPEPKTEPKTEPQAEKAAAKRETSELPEPRELPKKEGGGGGWVFLLVILVAGGVAGYMFRDRIMAFVNPPPEPAPSASASVAPSASASAAASASASAAPSASAVVEEPHDASAAVVEESDASSATSVLDAGHDGGHHHHDGGAHHARPKPSTTAAPAGGGNDNPY